MRGNVDYSDCRKQNQLEGEIPLSSVVFEARFEGAFIPGGSEFKGPEFHPLTASQILVLSEEISFSVDLV